MKTKTTIIITTALLSCACTKTSLPEIADNFHEIYVSVEEPKFSTKCSLEGGKVSFNSGDHLIVYDDSGNSGTFKFKLQNNVEGKEVAVFNQFSGHTFSMSSNLTAAYLDAPNGFTTAYNWKKSKFTIFIDDQEYSGGEKQHIYAPMICFNAVGKSFEFSNLSCLLKIGIRCSSQPDDDILIKHIKVTASNEDTPLCCEYICTQDDITIKSNDGNILSLINCELSGPISTDVKYYYISIPPLFDTDYELEEETFTVEVVPVSGDPFQASFTATKGGTNSIEKNTILEFPAFVLNAKGELQSMDTSGASSVISIP